MLIIAIVAIMVILFFIKEYAAISRKQKIEQDYYELNYEYSNKGLEAKTYTEAKRCLETLESGYPGDNAIQSRVSREVYHDDMRDLREHVKDLKEGEQSDWEGPAKWALDYFFKYYLLVTRYSIENVEKIQYNRDKCLYWWDRYWAVPVPNTTISPSEYISKKKDYEPSAMRDKPSLAEKLSQCVDESQSLMERKKEIAVFLRKKVKESRKIARSTLLSSTTKDYMIPEIKATYEWMKRKRQLKEIKEGNRYFVTLPTKK